MADAPASNSGVPSDVRVRVPPWLRLEDGRGEGPARDIRHHHLLLARPDRNHAEQDLAALRDPDKAPVRGRKGKSPGVVALLDPSALAGDPAVDIRHGPADGADDHPFPYARVGGS